VATGRRRCTFSAEFKARVLLKVLTGQNTAAQICREQQLKPDPLSRWKAELDCGLEAYGFRGEVWACKRVAEVIRRPCGDHRLAPAHHVLV